MNQAPVHGMRADLKYAFRELLRDRQTRFLVSAALLLLPALILEFFELIDPGSLLLPAPLLFAAATAISCFPRPPEQSGQGERALRIWLTLSAIVWSANYCLAWFGPASPERVQSIGVGLSALLVVLAVETSLPLRRPSDDLRDENHRLPGLLPPAGWFVVALWIYLHLLPMLRREQAADPESSAIFSMIATGYLLARALGLAIIAPKARRRAFYALFSVSLGAVFLRTVFLFRYGVPDDLLTPAGRWTWSLAFFFLALAGRWDDRWFPSRERSRLGFFSGDPGLGLASGLGTLGFGLLFPILHFWGYRVEIFEPRLAAVREAMVVFWLMLFGILAGWRYVRLEERARELWLRRIDEAENLKSASQDLRILIDRAAAVREQQISDKYFEIAFEKHPYALSIHRLSDGSFLRVNDSFMELAEYSREELLDEKPQDLGLYDSRREMVRIWRSLIDRGDFEDLEITFRVGSGTRRRLSVSASRLVWDQEGAVLMIVRPILRRRQALRTLWARSTRLERSRAAMFAIDFEGRIVSWNPAARSLVGLPESACVGRFFSSVLGVSDPVAWRDLARRAETAGFANDVLELNTRERWRLRVEVWATSMRREDDRGTLGTVFFFSPLDEAAPDREPPR